MVLCTLCIFNVHQKRQVIRNTCGLCLPLETNIINKQIVCAGRRLLSHHSLQTSKKLASFDCIQKTLGKLKNVKNVIIFPAYQ